MSRYLNKTIYFVITVPSIQLCNYYNIVIENVLTGIKCSKLSIFVDICIYLPPLLHWTNWSSRNEIMVGVCQVVINGNIHAWCDHCTNVEKCFSMLHRFSSNISISLKVVYKVSLWKCCMILVNSVFYVFQWFYFNNNISFNIMVTAL